MNKLISSLAAAALLIGSTTIAAAQSSNSNADAARNMAGTLSGTPGIGKAAPTVSGKNAIEGNTSDSGWGNAGSRVVAGDQVSRGSERGNKGGDGANADR